MMSSAKALDMAMKTRPGASPGPTPARINPPPMPQSSSPTVLTSQRSVLPAGHFLERVDVDQRPSARNEVLRPLRHCHRDQSDNSMKIALLRYASSVAGS